MKIILETKYSVGDKVEFKVKPDGEIMYGEIVCVTVTQGDYKRYPNEEVYTIFDGNKYYSIVVLGIVGDAIEELSAYEPIGVKKHKYIKGLEDNV